jgi:hypothetical protein
LSRVNEEMGKRTPYVRLPYLTTDWEFEPHTILLRNARKEWYGGQRETYEEWRDERIRFHVQGRTGEWEFWSQGNG